MRLARGDSTAAVVDLEAAIRRRPDWNQARVNLAQVELRLGRLDAALEQLNYQDRAVQLLRRAVALVPASRRGAFWTTIAPDPALDPIRRGAGFLQLTVENAGAAK